MPDLAPVIEFFQGTGLPVARIVVILIGGWIVLRLVTTSVHRIVQTLMDREVSEGTAQELTAVEVEKRVKTIEGLVVNVVRLLVILIALVMVLSQVGLDVGPAVAGLGVVGIAVGFGAQHLVKDYLNGALILIENQFGRGDVVRIAGVTGVVEDFSLRRTTLRDLDGNVHTVPNGEIAVATNLTRVWARVNEDITIGYGSDIDQVTELVARVGAEMLEDESWRRRILEAPKVERITELADSGVKVKILATVRAPERWAVAGELRKRLLRAFAENGVEIPFPHRVILTRSEPGSGDGVADDEAAAVD